MLAALAAGLAAILLGVPVAAPAEAGAAATRGRGRAADRPPRLASPRPRSPTTTGRCEITGTVTNQSAEPWTGVNLYAFRSTTPILDATSLAASAAIDPAEYVGDRIVEPGTFDTVDLLQPGQTADFSLSVPRELLGIVEPGAYWIGVHAIGDSSVPRDEFADGRARTFIPYVAPTAETLDTAVVVPVRDQVRHTASGRVSGVRRWATSLGDGGRLDAVLDAGEASGGTPISWLVDPAVLATVARLAAGNPRRSLAADPARCEAGGGQAEPADDGQERRARGRGGALPADLGGAPLGPTAPADEQLSDDKQAVATVAQAWLDRFSALVAGETVLSLPYGDLDVSAAATHGPVFYTDAMARGAEVMTALGIAHTPVLAPPDGLISPDALQAATDESTVLLGDTSFAVPPDAPNSMVRLLGHKVVVTSSGAASGGPGPDRGRRPARPAPAAAQRGGPAPVRRVHRAGGPRAARRLVPPGPGRPLQRPSTCPWLRPVAAHRHQRPPRGRPRPPRDLSYTEEDAATELGATSFSAAQALRQQAAVMAGVLTSPNLVRQQATDEALATLSVRQRPRESAAAASARAAAGYLDDQLADIDVVAPSSVTLSSEDGTLGATVVNGLDQPVTVRVEAVTDGVPRGRRLRRPEPRARGPLPAAARRDRLPARHPPGPAGRHRPGRHAARRLGVAARPRGPGQRDHLVHPGLRRGAALRHDRRARRTPGAGRRRDGDPDAGEPGAAT